MVVFDDMEDSEEINEAVLKKLIDACQSEKTYQSWKEKIIEEKIANLTNRKMVVCSYMFAGMGDYKETMLLDEVESFKEWIDQNGSAFFCGYEDATLEDVIAIADSKSAKRGAFEKRIFLEKVISDK